MACEYCNGDLITLVDVDQYGEGVTLEMRGNLLAAAGWYDGGYCCGAANVEVDYCPMCGERLGCMRAAFGIRGDGS